MGNAAWGWDRNWVLAGALTASSQVAGLGVGNLQNEQGARSRAWQTVGTDATLLIDARAVVPWRAFLVSRTNLTPSAVLRWRVGDDPAFGTWAYDSGNRPGPPRTMRQAVTVAPVPPGETTLPTVLLAENGEPLQLEDGSELLAETGILGRYCRLDISDPTNPDGFLSIPLAYAGPLVQTEINIGWGGGLGRVQGGAETRVRSGGVVTRLDWVARRQDVEHQGILSHELWPLVMAVDEYARRGGNVLFIPDPDSPNLAREAIYGRLSTTADITMPFQTEERRAWRATIEERL